MARRIGVDFRGLAARPAGPWTRLYGRKAIPVLDLNEGHE